MIVDPDFPDHWKTRMLVGLLDGDEAGGMYVIRLWGHCQLRRQWRFANLSPEALKALCRFPGHANKLEASLSASGFIRREADVLNVCGWDDYNASLIAAWGNGSKGGRPPKPTGSEPETHGKPTGSRVDGIGGDRKEPTYHPSGGVELASDFDRFQTTWNEVASAVGWIAFRQLTGKRRKALIARLADHSWKSSWMSAVERAKTIPGLSGSNDRNWRADVDWFLRPDTVTKILEGKYDHWGKTTANSRSDPTMDIMRKAQAAMNAKKGEPCPPT